MMSDKVAAAGIATLLASKVITGKDIEAPALIFPRETLISALGQLAILIGVMSLATGNLIALPSGFAHLFTSLYGVLLPLVPLFAFVEFAGFALRFFAVMLTLKGRHTALGRLVRAIDPGAAVTPGGKPVTSGGILIEHRDGLPTFTLRAPLLASTLALKIRFQRDTDSLCGDHLGALWSVCHIYFLV